MNSPYLEKHAELKTDNVVWHRHSVGKAERSQLKPHRPCVLWFTGLSGSGKSTIANAVESILNQLGCHTYLLDGDNVRHGLNGDLGFSDVDRVENIRRIAEVAKLFSDAGLIVLTAFISPFRAERQLVRELLAEGEFIEIFIDTPLEVCESRDPKGLYQKARAGEISAFTGISSPYEPPYTPELRLDSAELDVQAAAQQVVSHLQASGIVAIGQESQP